MWAESTWVYRVFSSFSVLLMTFDTDLQGVEGDASADVDHHLEMGKRLLAAGQLTDALSHYNSAIDGDPKNYLSYFKRAAVLLALGRSKAALPDLDQVVSLRPDFLKALIQRGSILLKLGEVDKASRDFQVVLEREPQNGEAHRMLNMAHEVTQNIASAKELYEEGQHQMVIDLLNKPIEACPWSVELREIRADCYEHVGEYFKSIQDLKPTTKLVPDNTDAYLKISYLYYAIGEGEDSLKEIRECLKLDQDHKQCFNHYKKVKKLVKFFADAAKYMDQNQYKDALFKLRAALKLENTNRYFIVNAKEKMCTCHLKDHDAKEAIRLCTETIEVESQNANAYCDRAEAYLLEDNLDQALADYQEAKNINNELQRAKEGIDRVNKLIKQSKKRDYFKILGVSRSAGKAEIVKKFRKLAAKWHPDRYDDAEEKKKAEKKFIDIAAAKEVLTDPEKRQKYEQGEDPLDPESQQGQGFDPFQGFNFHNFQGDGGGFKFHFN